MGPEKGKGSERRAKGTGFGVEFGAGNWIVAYHLPKPTP